MESTVKPQPLIAEVLPGLAVILILAGAHFAHAGNLTALINGNNTPLVVGGGFLTIFAAWIVGTFLDAVRDIAEHLFDRWWPMRWDYLLTESPENINKLDGSWLAYYFLNGNFVVGLIVTAVIGDCFQSARISGWGLFAILFAAAVYAANFWTLRQEIRRLIGLGLPHERVYARIGRSNGAPSKQFTGDAGVGVIAIRDIPKGTLVFAPDDDTTARVPAARITGLSSELHKLYTDFCTLEDNVYTCPISFNRLTVAWYLNDSETPNVEADESLRFRASRDIQAGEELFARYSDYSE